MVGFMAQEVQAKMKYEVSETTLEPVCSGSELPRPSTQQKPRRGVENSSFEGFWTCS